MHYKILQIDKPNGAFNPYTRITRVFVSHPLNAVLPNLYGFWLSVSEVISKLAQGETFFCTDLKGEVAEVKPYWHSVRPTHGGLLPGTKKPQPYLYIRTVPDDTYRNNLLFLPNASNIKH